MGLLYLYLFCICRRTDGNSFIPYYRFVLYIFFDVLKVVNLFSLLGIEICLKLTRTQNYEKWNDRPICWYLSVHVTPRTETYRITQQLHPGRSSANQNSVYLQSGIRVYTTGPQAYACIQRGPRHTCVYNGRSMTAPPWVISPSRVLPPSSSHCAIISGKKCLACISEMSLQFLYFALNDVTYSRKWYS